MALGGGTWQYQDKILPGTYINFTNPNLLLNNQAERGTVAVPIVSDWGAENEVIMLDSETILKESKRLLGYDLSSDNLLYIRELFKNAKKIIAYRIGAGMKKASNIYGIAKCGGARGNDIVISIKKNVDNTDNFIVTTYLEGKIVDEQEVRYATELLENDYVKFYKDVTLASNIGVPLIGGENANSVSGDDYLTFLSQMENYSFDILCLPCQDEQTTETFIAYTKRMCLEHGTNFQLVCYRADAPDCENIISVKNETLIGLPSYGLVYWVAGAQAACPISQTLTNKIYDGELEIDLRYNQVELKEAVKNGEFIFHNVNGRGYVLRDINTLTTYDYEKGEDFSCNQTVRICFDISNKIAELFNKRYLGKIANDQEGRMALWNDICKIIEDLQNSRVISDFDNEDVEVYVGQSKEKVVCSIKKLMLTSAMEALYMNIVVM